MAPNIAQHTKPTKFLCRNQPGKLLHLIHSEVQESANKDGSSYDGFIFPQPPTHQNSDVPPLSNSALEDILTTPPFDVTKKHFKNKVQQQDSFHLQTKTNKMTILNDSVDAYSQQLTSSHGSLTPCPPPRFHSKSFLKCGQRATMDAYIFVTRDSSVASVSSGKQQYQQ